MAEINVPIKLQIQNLQQLINDLQNKLSNLKVGSTGFKSLQNIITSMKNELDKLQIQSAKPFMDASQFTRAENSVEKLEDQLEKVQMTIGRLKFSDLELTPQQKSDLKVFEDQINSIKDKLKIVKDTAKSDFLKSDMGQEWLKIDETAFSKSLTQITNNIRRAVQDQKKELDDLKSVAVDYSRALSENERIKNFTEQMVDDPKNGTDIFSKKWQELTQQLNNGKVVFKSGGKNLMVSWLESQLQLDSSTLNSLLSKSVTASNIGAELKKLLNDQLAKNEQVISANPNLDVNIEAASIKYNELLNILRQVGLSEQQVAAVEQTLRNSLRNTEEQLGTYKDKLVEVARNGDDISSTTGAMRSQLESLRGTLQQTNAQFIQMQRTQASFNQMKMAVVNFMGFNQVLNLTKNAIKNAINHIRELDTVMNGISIVTDMSTSDLWDQVDAYSKMAQTYGVSIKGAYEVSQIYYQQGLQTADVLTLTNETLKLAKISGLDYATTTDYMTTALRGFKIEMSEASRVVDVYSNLAAHTAVSQEELAVAMSKTASSMEAVGATFEEASAMIGTMVAVTRESATNIGSAMKSIASRYGELTKDPTKLVDEEGEAMAFNKVDAALQSVGISMKTVDGQFREFTDVIVELGEKWDQLDSTQQRYIATQFAGNRQQSRFLALVSNVDLLKSNLDVARNSEDTGTLQALKALDSIEAKTEQVRVAYQQFYTTLGAENVWKGFLDGAKNVINTLNSFPKLFGKLPIGAIAAVANIVNVIKKIGIRAVTDIAEIFGSGLLKGFTAAESTAGQGAEGLFNSFINTLKSKLGIAEQTGEDLGKAVSKGINANTNITQTISPNQLTGINKKNYDKNANTINNFNKVTSGFTVTDPTDINEAYQQLAFNMQRSGDISSYVWKEIQNSPEQAKVILETYIKKLQETNNKLLETGDTAEKSGGKLKNFFDKHASGFGKGLQNFGSALHMISMMIDTTKEGGKTLSGAFMSISGAATLAGIGIQAFNGALDSIPWMAIATGIFALINGISTILTTPEERIEELTQKAEDLNNKAKEAKAEYRTLDNSIKKLDELKEKRYESAEAAEEYQTAVDELAEKFPEMIAGFDEAGNIILDTTNAEQLLAKAREKSRQATYDAAQAEFDKAKEQRTKAQNDLAGEQVASIKTQNYNTDQSKLIEDFLIKRLGVHETEAGEIAMQSSLEDKFQSLKRYDYTGGTAEFINIYNTLEEAKAYLDENLEQLSPLQKEFYNAFFGSEGSPNALIEEYNQIQDEINQLLNNPNEQNRNDIQKKYTKLKSLYDEAFIKYDSNALFDFETAAKSLEHVGKLIDDWNGNAVNTKGYEKELISAWQQSGKANVTAWEILSKSGMAAAMVTKTIQKDLNNQDWDFDNATNEQKKTWLNYQQQMADFIGSLNTDELATFETMMNDSANFTTEDFSDEFGYKVNDTIKEFLSNWFSDGITSINNRLTQDIQKASGEKNLDDLTGFYKEWNEARNALGENITTTEENYFHNILSSYQQLKSKGFTGSSQNFGSAALKLFNDVNNLTGGIEKTIWKLISDNGMNTIEGINATIDSIKLNTDIDNNTKESMISSLETIKSIIIPNINLSIQSATSELLESWSDTSSELSKAMSSGLTLSEADKLINQAEQLGVIINLEDFTSSGDKLILTAEKFEEYWKALESSTNTNTEEWQKKINQASFYLASLQNDGGRAFSEEAMITAIQSLIPDFNLQQYLHDETYQQTISEAIQKSQDGLNKLKWYNETAAKQLAESWNWDQGNYFGEFTAGDKVYESVFEDLNDLITGIEEDAVQHFSKTGENADKRALLDKVYESYDALISDVLSKGIENIQLDDYTGIIKDHKPAIQAALENGNYQAFIQEYVKYAGKTIDETNDLLVQAIEKQNESTSVDLIKDLQFTDKNTFKASLSQLKELANKLDVDLFQILNNAILGFNSITGEYIVDATKIDKLDLTSGDFQSVVRESVKEFFSDLASYISNAIKGSLKSEDAQTLQDFANKYGIGNLNFTETAEGLQLSSDSAWQLVQALRQVDAIQGNVAFDALKDSLMESDSRFKSISSTLATVSQLQEKLNVETHKYQEIAENVQLVRHARHQINGTQMQEAGWSDFNADDYATLFSSTYSGEEYGANFVLNITPITNDGRIILSPKDLDAYVADLMKNSSSTEEILLNDKKHLVMGAWDVDVSNAEELADGIAHAEEEAERLHEESDIISQNMESWDKPSDARIQQYEQELALAKEILAVRATTEDDSFNFMSNKIPGAQNNPLNYWKNWITAMDTIKASQKSGSMGYEAFYNIVTEMGKIAELTKDGIKFGNQTLHNSQEAADLITQAAGALSNINGEIKIDFKALADIGIDFSSGAEEMSKGVSEGIEQVAQSQIDMLDALIAMMELIVTMEQLGDIDVQGNGIDLSELFKVNADGTTNWDEFNKTYDDWRKEVLDKIDETSENFNQDLANAVKGININGFSLEELLNFSPDEIHGASEAVQNAYTAVLTAFSRAAKSGNYDLDNIQASILEVLAQSGLTETIPITIGEMTYYISGTTVTMVNWEAPDMADLLKKLETETGKTKTELENWISEYGNGTLTGDNEINGDTKLKYVLSVKKNIELDENGNITSVTVNGKTYKDPNQIKDAMYAQALLDSGLNFNTDSAIQDGEGKGLTIPFDTKGKSEIEVFVTSDENGVKWHYGDQIFDTKQEMFDKVWEETAGDKVNDTAAKEHFLWEKFGVRAHVEAHITKGGTEVDIQNDPGAREALKQEISRAAQEDVSYDFDGTGNVPVTLSNGMVVTLDGDTVVDAEGKIDKDKIAAELQKLLGTDTALVDNISQAISNAFNNDAVKSAISGAIKEGMEAAVSGAQGTEGTPTEIPLPSITLVPTTIAIDPSKGTATLPDGTTVPIGTVNAAVALLKMLKGTGYNQNNDDLTVEDIDVPSLSALVYALELVKQYGTQTEGDVVVEDLTKDDLQALITCLTLVYGKGYYQNPGDVTADNLTDEKIQAWITVLTLLNKYGTQDNGDVAAADLTDEQISAFITLLTLAQGEGYTQNPGSVIPANLHIDSIYAFIQQLILQKAYSEQNEGDVKPEDLTKDLYAKIKTLYLKWLSEQNIDPSQLGLDSDLYSQDTLTYHQKVDIKYELTDNQKFLQEYAQQLAINRHEKNLNKDTGITHQDYQVESPISGRSTRSFSDINVNSQQYNDLEKYINLLKEDIGQTGVLNPQNRENLKALSDTIGDTNNENLIALKETISEILAIDETNSENITGMLESVSNVSADNLILVAGAIERIAAAVSILATTPWSEIANGLSLLNGGTPTVPPSTPQSDSSQPSADQTIPDASESLQQTAEQLGQVNQQSAVLNPALNSLFQGMIDSTSGLNQFNGKVEETGSKSTQISSSISTAISSIQNLASAIRNIPASTTHEVKLDISATVTEGAGSKGNVKLTSISPDSPFTSISFAKGNALARGQTLMGELGPELVVSGGRYFIVGQGGAEFVNLAPDAIVFNHKQTASLLNNGKAGRGKPITNERTAIAWAKGNIGFASADGTKVDNNKRKTNTDELKKNLLKQLNKNTLEEEIVVPIDNIILDGSNAEAHIKDLPKIAKPSDEEYTPTVQTRPAQTPVNLPDTTTTGNIFQGLQNNFQVVAGFINSTLGEALNNLQVDASTENATTALQAVATEAAALNETTATVKTDAETENAKRKMRQLKQIVNKTPLAKAVGINVDKKQIKTAKDNVQSQFSNKPFYGSVNYTANTSTAKTAIEELKSESNIAITAEDKTSEVVSGIDKSITDLTNKKFTVTVNVVQKNNSGKRGTGGEDHGDGESHVPQTASAKGTLMGELGPELVVSNGRYFVVGQNGPEFVNLADDAIVFNHLQTDSLFKHGMSKTRGKAVTNEQNAVAFAEGNVNGGPAMASAADALAALKQLREMWKQLLGLSLQDLTSTGSGGGGGGGDKGRQEFLKDVERWYNLLQKIAELEEKITYEENRRKLLTVSGVKDGKAYYASLKQSLAALKESVEANAQLAREQEEYFNKRRKELDTEGAFRKFYTFDERGQIQFKNFDKGVTINTKDSKGKDTGPKTFTSAFEFLNEINKKDAGGKSVYSTKEQLEMFKKALGKEDYNSIYKEIKASLQKDKKKGEEVTEQEILEALWSKMEGDKSEMQSLHDSIQDYQNAVIEAQEKQAQIIKEMKDNQLAVEKDVYDAIVDMRERAIDEMKDLRDAYEDSTNKFIDGLNNALNKERQMYQTQQAESDLDKKRRRVAILQRTGGSGAEIASLQAEIESDEQELYFEKQQQEIDAIKEAADKQIEKLDQQIELEEELLEYQKEHGLLWQDVSKIMRGTSDEIVSFITTNNSEWWAKSPLATAQDLEDALFKAEQWTQFRDDDGKYFEEILAAIQRVAEGKQPKEEDSTASEEQQQEYNKKEGSKSIEEKSKYKVTYTDGQGEQQTRYFRSKKWAEEFKKTYKKDYKDISVEKLGTKNYWIFAHKLNWQEGDEPEIFGPYNKEFATMKTQELKKSVYYDDKYIKMEQGKYNKKTKKYEQPKKPQGFSAGGLNTTTGLAMLHGTPEKPEAVFNAEQTEILRNKILSNKPTSLLSLLQSLQGAMATAANNTTNINRSAATEIGSIALNMNVSQIANDYDAKRAGEQAMTEMLRIARKTNVTAIRG